jgi:hypothetical protein
MKKYVIAVACSAIAGSLLMLSVPAVAQQKTEKECRAEWKAAGGRKATGKTEKDYVAGCHVAATAQPGTSAATPAPTTGAPEQPATTTTKPARTRSTATTKGGGGREAMIARERACGKDWKADKAAGKIPQGMTWPKYWSECNTRKKAEGM